MNIAAVILCMNNMINAQPDMFLLGTYQDALWTSALGHQNGMTMDDVWDYYGTEKGIDAVGGEEQATWARVLVSACYDEGIEDGE